LIKKTPPPGHKLVVLGTTSQGDVIESMGLSEFWPRILGDPVNLWIFILSSKFFSYLNSGEVFNVSLHVPSLRVDEIVRVVRSLDLFELRDIPEAVEALTSATSKLVPIKKLLLWLEMAKQDVAPGQKIPITRWRQVLNDLS
jgi:vesicle-fusing ATPase